MHNTVIVMVVSIVVLVGLHITTVMVVVRIMVNVTHIMIEFVVHSFAFTFGLAKKMVKFHIISSFSYVISFYTNTL